jgi:hypothetical protein
LSSRSTSRHRRGEQRGCLLRGGPRRTAAAPASPASGRTGTVLISPFIKPGTDTTPYNHYSLLRTIEDLFQLAPLGYAADARGFGRDVFGKPA